MTPDTGPDLSYIHPDLRALAVPLDTLTPDPRNARKHSATNLEAIRVSLVRWGMREPIVVQRGSNGSMIIGNGWVGIVAMTKPAPRVLAIQASTAAVIAANMLGSSCRRTRTDALTFIAETAHGSFPTMLSLLSRRRKSAGCSEVEARMMRLGELLGTDQAILCSRLFELAELDGTACIALAPDLDDLDDDDDACDSTSGTHH